MKKIDIYLIFGILVLAVTLFVFFRPRTFGADTEMRVEIYVEGQLVQAVPLPAQPEDITLRTADGYNILRIDSSGAQMLEADCYSQDCVRHAKITRPNTVIVCLPHRVIVKLTGQANISEGDIDIVAR